MKRYIITIFTLAAVTVGFSQDRILLIPGIKITKILDGESGVNFGFDLSLLIEPEDVNFYWGINSTYDFSERANKLTFGAEYLYKEIPVGISIGPALSFRGKKNSFGIYTVGFIALPVVIAWQYTYLFKEKNIPEFGVFGKLPIQIGGKKEGLVDFDFSGSFMSF